MAQSSHRSLGRVLARSDALVVTVITSVLVVLDIRDRVPEVRNAQERAAVTVDG